MLAYPVGNAAVKTPLKGLHLIIGLLALVTFLLTGQYMRYHIHHLMEADDRLRFSLRGNHIYILLSALINLGLGAYLHLSFVRWKAYAQRIGSLLVLAATVLIVLAFFFESKASLERPYTFWAAVMFIAGTTLHIISGFRKE